MVIHPGDEFSTADVFTGLVWGLRANGHTVHEARLDEGLVVMSEAVEYFRAYFPGTPPAWAQDAFALVGPRIVAQAAWLQPDMVIAVNGLKLHYSVPLTLRKIGLATAILMTETPYSVTERNIAPMYDHVLTNERRAIRDQLFGNHPSVYYVAHGYNPDMHYPHAIEPELACDVCFIGTGFTERKKLFDGVDWTGITKVIRGAAWAIDLDKPIEERNAKAWDGVTDNRDTARLYRNAKMSINHFRTTTEIGSGEVLPSTYAESLGPRAYEIPACGGFMISDYRAELVDVFGDSVPTYKAGDSADLERVIRYYLANPDEREALRQEQCRRVQGQHWGARAARVIDLLAYADQVRIQAEAVSV